MKYSGLNSFQQEALIDLEQCCHEARPYRDRVLAFDGYRWRDLYDLDDVDRFISKYPPLEFE